MVGRRSDEQDEHGDQSLLAPYLGDGADTLNAILEVFRLNGLGLGVAGHLVGVDCSIAPLLNVYAVRGTRKALCRPHHVGLESVVRHGQTEFPKRCRPRQGIELKCRWMSIPRPADGSILKYLQGPLREPDRKGQDMNKT